MRIFLGQTRGGSVFNALKRYAEHGVGEMTQPREFPPRRKPWALDNGAYLAWTAAGRPFPGRRDLFNADGWSRVLPRLGGFAAPDFAVVPDVVAGGDDSLAFSIEWLHGCRKAQPHTRWMLAVQNGMERDAIAGVIKEGFGGLFVGGTEDWKWETASTWIDVAHRAGMPCHIGRAKNVDMLLRARELGADSVDTSQPLWSRRATTRYLAAFLNAEMFPHEHHAC